MSFLCRANLSRLRFRKASGLSPNGANPLYVYRPVCLTTFPVNPHGLKLTVKFAIFSNFSRYPNFVATAYRFADCDGMSECRTFIITFSKVISNWKLTTMLCCYYIFPDLALLLGFMHSLNFNFLSLKCLQDAEALNVIIDPGLAFGTGEHPTTRLCLQWLHQVVSPGDKVLDYGTGSGILSIASLKVFTHFCYHSPYFLSSSTLVIIYAL